MLRAIKHAFDSTDIHHRYSSDDIRLVALLWHWTDHRVPYHAIVETNSRNATLALILILALIGMTVVRGTCLAKIPY